MTYKPLTDEELWGEPPKEVPDDRTATMRQLQETLRQPRSANDAMRTGEHGQMVPAGDSRRAD